MKAIRANVITLITPVLEVDGRDRVVDPFAESRALKLGPYGVPLVYWGKYTAHDNNRDGMVLSQKLTQNFVKGFLSLAPDHRARSARVGAVPLHEHRHGAVQRRVRPDRDRRAVHARVPGDDRAHSPRTARRVDARLLRWLGAELHVLSVASLHNSLGRFYETYTSQGAECHIVHLPTDAVRRMGSHESAGQRRQVVHPHQHQLSAVGGAGRAPLRGRQPTDLPRELRREGGPDGAPRTNDARPTPT